MSDEKTDVKDQQKPEVVHRVVQYSEYAAGRFQAIPFPLSQVQALHNVQPEARKYVEAGFLPTGTPIESAFFAVQPYACHKDKFNLGYDFMVNFRSGLREYDIFVRDLGDYIDIMDKLTHLVQPSLVYGSGTVHLVEALVLHRPSGTFMYAPAGFTTNEAEARKIGRVAGELEIGGKWLGVLRFGKLGRFNTDTAWEARQIVSGLVAAMEKKKKEIVEAMKGQSGVPCDTAPAPAPEEKGEKDENSA